jgi:hypothetical protein
MHGNRSNIVLMEKERVVEIFKNNLVQDLELDIRSLSKSINTSFENFEAQDGRYKSIIPTFGKAFDPYFNKKEYFNLSIEKKYEIFTELLEYLDCTQNISFIQKTRINLFYLFIGLTKRTRPLMVH